MSLIYSATSKTAAILLYFAVKFVDKKNHVVEVCDAT